MRELKNTKEWLGPIPKNWDYIPGKYVFRYRSEKGNDIPVLLAATQKKGMYPQDLLEGVVKVKENTDLQQFQTIHKNDYVISLRSFQGGFEMSDYEGVCSPAYQVFFNQKPIEYRYYKYLFKSVGFIQEMDSVTVGIREGKNIPYANFGKTFIPYPSLNEQSRIASFLDSHIAKIDDSIARYKALSDKLDEYRKAVITKAVTKGVRSKRIMRDSGFDRIGLIPSEWYYRPLKSIGRFYGGMSGKAGNDFVVQEGDTFTYYIPYTNIFNNSVVNPSILAKVKAKDGECQNCVHKGDLLFLMSSEDYAGLGQVSLMLSEISNLWLNSFCKGLTNNTNDVNSQFLNYYLTSELIHDYIREKGEGFTRINLKTCNLGKCPVFVPPIDEQAEIVAYLDRKCSDIDSSKKKIEAVVKKLEEYKKSLIYYAVTGKIEC